ncbi:unnamed protein product [Aureobasidium mustum]|uniref:Uncharacterized protein n=1 Tax=Aureobasidium mustum TaxID=2773714 RepID=A0A9N8K0S8_9PEZI|nr:unnamed protein product [Aureobasidium mustum]
MEPSLAKSTEHAEFVNKQFLRAEELYDANSLDECVKIHRDLMLKHYTAPGFAPLKTHMRLCELVSDWKYADAGRQGAEHLYEYCSKHPDRYDPGVLAEFRASSGRTRRDLGKQTSLGDE